MSGILEGKAAVVTGAGGGIGRAVSLTLAEQGASVVVNDPGASLGGDGKDAAPAERVVAEIRNSGGTAVPNYESVTDFSGAKKIIQTCLDNFGKIDVLVNVAGIERAHMIYNMTEEEWTSVIQVHLTGTFNCSRHACAIMKEQGSGRIINTTSDAWRGTVGHVNYGAAKGGIVSLTISTALEMGRYGVTSNAIAPIAATRMTLSEDTKAGLKKRLEAGLITQAQYDASMNTPGPEHVGPLVAYLASDQAGNINGQVFHVEGGRLAIYSQPVEVKVVYRDYQKYGRWTVEDVASSVRNSLLSGYVNPAPARDKKS